MNKNIRLIFNLLNVAGWGILLYIIWSIFFLYNEEGYILLHANLFSELIPEFIIINIIFVFVLIITIKYIKKYCSVK